MNGAASKAPSWMTTVALDGLAAQPEEVLGQDQVPGRGHREKLGETFDDAQQQGLAGFKQRRIRRDGHRWTPRWATKR